MPKTAIIIGAGPAGLTAAYELLQRTDIVPIIMEKTDDIGGISKTINYKGNRMDMGPHRFFSKSDRVMEWWLKIMPLTQKPDAPLEISYQNKKRVIEDPCSYKEDNHAGRMLVIPRLTRIYFLRKFFSYPIQFSLETLKSLGLTRTIRILLSFLKARLLSRTEKNLEDFMINRFGKALYLLFFKDYTEKVWGHPCNEISAAWGAQRIKGLSLSKAILSAARSLKNGKSQDITQKDKETSLIEQFLYPQYGPGSLWEEVARQIEEKGGKIYKHHAVSNIYTTGGDVCSIHATDTRTGELVLFKGNYFFSSMPIQELIETMEAPVPEEVKNIAAGLQYRDFINVGILLKQLSGSKKNSMERQRLELKDNWIYIQERDVKVGRLMIYNNWGGSMINDPNTTWIGMEYFCNKTDEFWALDDAAIQAMAIAELEKMDLACVEDVLDSTVQRMEKTYPAYFGTYEKFPVLQEYISKFSNLFLVGRNGMHKYNNADHSMLTAMVSVDNIIAGVTSKENIWSINTEQEYHEEKKVIEKPTVPQGLFPSLQNYLWNNKLNRSYFLIALLTFILQFIWFKIKYPFANYMPDSYSYLEAASTNADINMWPVAYSKFLRLVSVFSHSDWLVVGVQYFFMQLCTLTFFYTILHFLRPGRLVRNMLFIIFVFNPVPLYISNYISADALFIGLSLLWFTTLIWVIYQPSRWQIILHAILLLACFAVRYNAIYYPVISILAFMISKQSWPRRLVGIGLGLLLVSLSFLYTSGKMKELTGHRQFSAFGGWQLANNALYMYEHIPSKQRGQVPAQFAGLDTMVRQHMDTLKRVKLTKEDSLTRYFYLWNGRGPLHQYLQRQWKKDSITPYFKRWASEGPFYLSYALYLIKKYPWSYMENFMFPNAIKLAAPPTEFLGTYNMGGDSVGGLAKNWFQYKSLKVKDHNRKGNIILYTEWYPIYSAMTNLLLIIHLAGLLFFGSFKQRRTLFKLLPLGFSLWLLNMGFSIFSSPIVLRYQAFPLIIITAIALLTGEIIYTSESKIKTASI
ncbi:MAG TPA: NAD(P)/FAD-dependent oxidoreductase [Puia sp.]|nr:NAD(P)/FAD-dependent oxidoreductase [Puia sp.]